MKKLLLIPVAAMVATAVVCTAYELWDRHVQGLPIGWQPAAKVARRQPVRVIGGDAWYGGSAA